MDQPQIDALLDPAAYPELTVTVAFKQTHISCLFLTDRHVYKFKKPVDFGFLDFTTPEKRRFYCHEEVRLNRRLSPDIYLGVVELRRDEAGGLRIDGPGDAIDYAVKMARLPEARIMARLLERGEVAASDVTRLARLIAGFHRGAARGPAIDRFGTPAAIRNNWQENLVQVAPYAGRTVSPAALAGIGAWVERRLAADENLLQQRVAGGFIREVDGDLHSENIFLDERIHVFDCIEFNEKFRCTDTAADVAFLAMDLENHGRRDLAERFVADYVAASGDKDLPRLLPLYLANRALIRGKVESFRLDDPLIPADERTAAAARANRFFRLTLGYAVRNELPPCLFLTCAPTGSGKSTLAAELAFLLGCDRLASDIVRKGLAGLAPQVRGEGIYTTEWNERTYDRLAGMADERLARGESVLVDATFIRRHDRQRFAALATTNNARLIILRLDCPAATVRQRLADRQADPRAVSDGTWEVYRQQVAVLEEPTPAEGRLIRLTADRPPAELAEEALLRLG